jgi:spoIIIJ-associated protein
MEKAIKKLVADLLVQLRIDFSDVEVEIRDGNVVRVNVGAEEPSLLIGHHGENLNAMQKIVKVMVHKEYGEEVDVLLDVDNYRQRQEENVLSIATQKMEEAAANGMPASLPPMSPYFRRLVHMHVLKHAEGKLTTESMGQGNYRQVVIKKR